MKPKITFILPAVAAAALTVLAGVGTHPPAQDMKTGNPPPATVVNDPAAKAMLLGSHKFSCQWISWDDFGTADITEENGVLRLKAEQRQRDGTDFAEIEGFVTEVNARSFLFQGTIVTQISHINGGRACRREGAMTFRITGKRKYWRLMNMQNPCEDVVDYLDIYFK